jgi:hypothetical protein
MKRFGAETKAHARGYKFQDKSRIPRHHPRFTKMTPGQKDMTCSLEVLLLL